MDHTMILQELSRNKEVFSRLLAGTNKEMYVWKYQPDKWCLLEIICHLHDEEREDFRARTKHILETPYLALPSIDPQGWVSERRYIDQSYDEVLSKFLEERKVSVQWLQSLQNPDWNITYQHPKFGPMSAKMMLSNWLAHDYIHIRQVVRVKYYYLKYISGEELSYAGTW